MGMSGAPKIPLRQLVIGGRMQEAPPVIPQPTIGIGRLRKIALIGAAKTVECAPWYDPTWEIWAHSTCYPYCKRVDRYFDLHPWKWISEKPVAGYLDWIKTVKTPIYMQRKFKDVPFSVRYPKERVMAEYPRYFTSQAAWMIALALSEGVTHLGFFGIHYALDEEHRKQRAGCEYWMGVAIGKGVQIVNPEGSPLLREPGWLYGYESHSGKEHVRKQTGGKKPGVDYTKPPQNRALTIIDEPTVQLMRSVGRTDIPFDEKALARQLVGV
jgi:hypothetical protein